MSNVYIYMYIQISIKLSYTSLSIYFMKIIVLFYLVETYVDHVYDQVNSMLAYYLVFLQSVKMSVI